MPEIKNKSMEKKYSNMEDLKKNNPFLVPEGYMEGLTAQIMSQLPEKETPKETPKEKPKSQTVYSRMRPWFYAAAVFVGLCFFANTYIDFERNNSIETSDMWSDGDLSDVALSAQASDEDFFEYVEAQYSVYMLEAEMEDFE